MRPGATVPCSLAGLLAVFRPCFTAPTFHTFVGLVVGLIAQTRRRTVCGMLTGGGLDQVWHHSRAHRLFTNARWSSDAVGLALADLIVARLLPAGSRLTIAVDDTLFRRSGKPARRYSGWPGITTGRRKARNRSGSATAGWLPASWCPVVQLSETRGPDTRRAGESNRPSPTPARSSEWAKPAIGHAAPWNGRCRSG